jgi:hypothetical protein
MYDTKILFGALHWKDRLTIFHHSRFARAGGANDLVARKISHANTPRKFNVVQLLSVSARKRSD